VIDILFRAKLTNDSNFFVREVGRVLERSLEVTEVLRGGGRRWWRQEADLHIFLGKGSRKFIAVTP